MAGIVVGFTLRWVLGEVRLVVFGFWFFEFGGVGVGIVLLQVAD